jgi:hypothetical protein
LAEEYSKTAELVISADRVDLRVQGGLDHHQFFATDPGPIHGAQ